MVYTLVEKAGGLQPFIDNFIPKVVSGEIKYLEHRTNGLENIGEALFDVLTGKNMGKSIVVVSDE